MKNHFSNLHEKSPTGKPDFNLYGLVSTGDKISVTILNIISSLKKNFSNYFFNIFFMVVDKGSQMHYYYQHHFFQINFIIYCK